jgi:hypothetical protein
MKRLLDTIRHFFAKNTAKTAPNPLGRWNIDYCSKKINHKIDLSNEDHCGPCGQYIITKIPKPIFHDENNKLYNYYKSVKI